jgi:hypothetical protein
MEGYKKYAKWKAVQITQCLARGETPPAGPLGWADKSDEFEFDTSFDSFGSNDILPPPSAATAPPAFPSQLPNAPSFGMDVEIPAFPSPGSLNNHAFPDVPEVPSFLSTNPNPSISMRTNDVSPPTYVHTNPSLRPTAPPQNNSWQRDQEEARKKMEEQQRQLEQRQQQERQQHEQRLQMELRKRQQEQLQQQKLQQEQMQQQKLQELQHQQKMQMQLQQQAAQQRQANSPSRTSNGAGHIPSGQLNATARHILQQQEWRPTYVPGDFIPDEDAIIDATQHAKYVLSALQFDDVPTAIKNLCYCLKKLTGDDKLFDTA